MTFEMSKYAIFSTLVPKGDETSQTRCRDFLDVILWSGVVDSLLPTVCPYFGVLCIKSIRVVRYLSVGVPNAQRLNELQNALGSW